MKRSRHYQTQLNQYLTTPISSVRKDQPKKQRSESIFVTCPVCERKVLPIFINDHLDKGCQDRMSTANSDDPFTINLVLNGFSSLSFVVSKVPSLPGLYSIHNFITAEEEMSLLSSLDNDTSNPWTLSQFNGKQMVKKWGLITDYAHRKIRMNEVSKGEFPFPPYMAFILERLQLLKTHGFKPLCTFDFVPNEGNSMSYTKKDGHFLRPHYDDRFLSGPLLINISLLSDATMTYTNEKSSKSVSVNMPRRSLHVVSMQARYDYTHGISNDHIHGERRVSIVLRQVGEKP